jgi:hypothetical protein
MFDKITEEIAHFIGVFHVSVEDARFREAYQQFSFNPAPSGLEPLAVIGPHFTAPYELLGYDPGFDYRSPRTEPWHAYARPVKFHDTHHPNNIAGKISGSTGYDWPRYEAARLHWTVKYTPPDLEPPGSVANYIHQIITLSDDDYFSVGGHNLAFLPDAIDNSRLLATAQAAVSLSPLGDLQQPGSGDEIITLIKASIVQIETAQPVSNQAVQVFLTEETIEGVYVNGQLVTEAPRLEDYHSFGGEQSAAAARSNTWTMDTGTVAIKASVELLSGGNTLVNEALLKNFWTGGTVTAIVGDHVELNVIVQTNAVWDTDAISSSIGLPMHADANTLFNVATFERLDVSNHPDASSSSLDHYPKYWSVTEVKGDLMVVNWLEQFTFMSDNDIGVLSSSGVTTSVVAGNNIGVNHVSIYELGFAYDLIIVGGSVYDANYILQTNVLFDNDVIGAAEGFHTAGKGEISSSANLLWNQAHITNLGNPDRFSELPQHYLDTANGLAGGGTDIPDDVRSDDAFAGLQGLSVLYIQGDLLNLQYIRQTNILGDNDQIALAKAAVATNFNAEWSVSTGSNTLVNSAAIADLDSLGKTYVGGGQYSLETLYHAEMISQHPEFGGPHPDALVNEAVLFLDDSMLDATDTAHTPYAAEHDMNPDDGVNSVLGH